MDTCYCSSPWPLPTRSLTNGRYIGVYWSGTMWVGGVLRPVWTAKIHRPAGLGIVGMYSSEKVTRMSPRICAKIAGSACISCASGYDNVDGYLQQLLARDRETWRSSRQECCVRLCCEALAGLFFLELKSFRGLYQAKPISSSCRRSRLLALRAPSYIIGNVGGELYVLIMFLFVSSRF